MSVRVRFAPSPTGFLHIGNARAAIINWLFAKHHGGHFLLRLDDTDLERSKQEYTDAIMTDMAWLGLTHDAFAKQSDRFGRYDAIVQQLIASGRLYPCYETQEELDFKRKRQLAKGQPPLYDRAALSVTDAQKKEYETQGIKPHWRFKLNPGKIVWDDLVRGHVEYEGDRLSDPVLVRADGAYLYTLTSVVDDIDFNITHILRGEDHVTNTAVQIQLFEAITGAPTSIIFGHTTLLMDAQGHPLSKRLGSLSLQAMQAQGVEPMAICSLMARLGTSLPVEPFTDLLALAQTFDLSTFSRTPPHFDEHDLTVLNHKIFQLTPYNAVEARLRALGLDCAPALWELIRGNISTLADVTNWLDVMRPQATFNLDALDGEFLSIALATLPNTPWDENTWVEWTNTLKSQTGRKGKELFMPLRRALTGREHGPEMRHFLPLLGYETVYKRLMATQL